MTATAGSFTSRALMPPMNITAGWAVLPWTAGDISPWASALSARINMPSIRYTGRSPNDPPGQMTFYEEEIMAGTGIQTGSVARWGDYSMMSVDPADDTTFWFTTEYVKQIRPGDLAYPHSRFPHGGRPYRPCRVNDLSAACQHHQFRHPAVDCHR